LTREIGARFFVIARDKGHDLIAHIHHSCTDAQGMITFLEDLIIEYAVKQGNIEMVRAPRKLEPELLVRRGSPMLSGWSFLKMLHKQALGLRGVLRFLRNTPMPLADRQGEPVSPIHQDAHSSPLVHEFNQIETQRIMAAARKATVNASEILLRDLFLAIFDWRKKHSLGNDLDCMRISFPIGLRSPSEIRMPMANCFSMVFLDRQAELFQDPHFLLRSIHEQMCTIKDNQLQYTFLLSLGVARKLPGGLSRFLSGTRCHATSCFSNIGKVFILSPLPTKEGKLVLGELELDSLDFVLPLRPHMHAAFTAHMYGGCLRLLINYDHRRMTKDDARDLLEGFLGKIHRTMGVTD
jgi:NRPS condensation-like uncharacterized protein